MTLRRKSHLALSRRRLLKGTAASLPLPLLEAMLPIGKSAFAEGETPQRFLAYYVPNGMHMPSWRPVGSGANFTFGETMAPLQALKDDVLILTGLANRPATPDGNGAHAGGTGAFLTATKVRKTSGANIANGVSVDQMIAAHYRDVTRFASLELGLDGGGSAGDCDSGFSCAYTRNIAWSGPRTPVPKTIDPALVYARLFSNPYDRLDPSQKVRRASADHSVLDLVKSQTQALQRQLGSRDSAKLEEYFTQVRALELKLAGAEHSCNSPEAPEATDDVTARVDIMADLMVAAFECDLTRVATYMLGNAGSWRTFSFIGVNDQHHQVSHHQGLKSNQDKIKRINLWELERFAYLLNKLKTTQDITGSTLLDNSLVFLGSEISDGDRHNHNDMPVLLAGANAGKFRSGEHVSFAVERSMGDLFLTIANTHGLALERFGDDGEKSLDEILRV